MILADTSVWIDHLRQPDALLQSFLGRNEVLSHPLVVGELAVGSLRQRGIILARLQKLPKAETADHGEVLSFIERHSLFGLGLGYIDCHLLVAVSMMPGAALWTRDKRLAAAARRLGLGVRPEGYMQ